MATQPPEIPLSAATHGPTSPHTGQFRWNSPTSVLEIWDGAQWRQPDFVQGDTWQEWFDNYVKITRENSDPYARRDKLNQLMQEKFPGQYQVDCHNGTWVMIHDTPADETWFHLQYE
jgi:hypothetical protein